MASTGNRIAAQMYEARSVGVPPLSLVFQCFSREIPYTHPRNFCVLFCCTLTLLLVVSSYFRFCLNLFLVKGPCLLPPRYRIIIWVSAVVVSIYCVPHASTESSLVQKLESSASHRPSRHIVLLMFVDKFEKTGFAQSIFARCEGNSSYFLLLSCFLVDFSIFRLTFRFFVY